VDTAHGSQVNHAACIQPIALPAIPRKSESILARTMSEC